MKIEKIEFFFFFFLLIYMIKVKCIINLRNLKQALNHRLVLKKVHRVIKFNQKV